MESKAFYINLFMLCYIKQFQDEKNARQCTSHLSGIFGRAS